MEGDHVAQAPPATGLAEADEEQIDIEGDDDDVPLPHHDVPLTHLEARA